LATAAAAPEGAAHPGEADDRDSNVHVDHRDHRGNEDDAVHNEHLDLIQARRA
jgi:hypothetical protein